MDLRKRILHNRLFWLGAGFVLLFGAVTARFYQLQILNGADSRAEFADQITREQTTPGARGMIYDRNGNVLAYNELTYAVSITDSGTYGTRSERNAHLNGVISETIDVIESYGDSLQDTLPIAYDAAGSLSYTQEGTALRRFLADVYGHGDPADLAYNDRLGYDEAEGRPEQVMEYLTGESMYGISPEYQGERARQIASVRFAMGASSYQRYRAVTLAENVRQETVVHILERQPELTGVDIQTGTLRRYADSLYFAPIIGYTGPISSEELEAAREQGWVYDASEQVGKTGIEQAMESTLRGRPGRETFYVDSVGRVTQVLNSEEPAAGEDVWLTIDAQLQETIYHLLEQKLAGILLSNLVPEKDEGSDEWSIDTRDVILAVIENQVLDTAAFGEADAGAGERRLYAAFQGVRERHLGSLEQILGTAMGQLPEDMQRTAAYIPDMLEEAGYVTGSPGEEEARSWQRGEMSLGEYLRLGIRDEWIAPAGEEDGYATLSEAWQDMQETIRALLPEDAGFEKLLYRTALDTGEASGRDVCMALFEQGVLPRRGSLPQ